MTILKRINSAIPLLLDGATGSLLQQRGFKTDKYLWSSYALISAPSLVIDIHKEYINAGADIITTNTFRTNPYAVSLSGYSFTSKQLVKEAVKLAKDAVGNRNIIIAGSNSPAEDCYQKEVTISNAVIYDNHSKHIEYLIDSGVDIILNETLSHLNEIKIVCDICQRNNFPFIISLFFDESLNLLSGEPISEAIDLVKEYHPNLISFNCIKPEYFNKLLNEIKIDFDWGLYLNCGLGNYTDDEISSCITPDEYSHLIDKLLNERLKMIGTCCGSSPAHIKKLREFLDEKYKIKS